VPHGSRVRQQCSLIQPEPRSRRDARQCADKGRWIQAEKKELDTLLKMGTFELVDKVEGEEYYQLPFQFVYKLKAKDYDFDHCTFRMSMNMVTSMLQPANCGQYASLQH
jgi:hypothetical protein